MHCHSERSEESPKVVKVFEILHFVQDDNNTWSDPATHYSTFFHPQKCA